MMFDVGVWTHKQVHKKNEKEERGLPTKTGFDVFSRGFTITLL